MAFAVAALLPLAGCGFQPLYGNSPGGQAVSAKLSQIRVKQIADRNGQRLANQLRDSFAPTGVSVAPTYQLAVNLNVARADLLGRSDGTATRTNVTVHADWVLTRLSDGNVILKGSSDSISGHDVIEINDYANVVATDTDTSLGLRDVGDDIRERVSAYFETQS